MPTTSFPSVLLVDDAPDTLASLSAALVADGFHVRTASSGRQALELMRQERPTVLVADLEMPDMDGYELARRARELCPDEVLLVALSGTLPCGKSALTNCFGFDHLFGKPVQLGILEDVLRLDPAATQVDPTH
ncbi:response regulator [Roseateles amylovorans]|uniref:Response regulator n=1 Tax=Roseateles amylovorans TaxID=2978473 RepID=A0ABY6AXU8_9BURK|nr:response regulator [Roseateles amylovorans]UXH76579.1 response regulator [Roseateles amylovorans]